MRKIAVIDADSIIYILGWHNRDHPYVEVMHEAVKKFMENIVLDTKATHYIGAFSPKETFRNKVATIKPYKGNRPSSPDWINFWKPKIIEQCITEYGFFVADFMEADDILSISRNGFKEGDEVILISPDKDMAQIPGVHYNYAKKIWNTITPEQAEYNLWRQVLVGDTGDNIAGLPGVGAIRAEKILTTLPTGTDYRDAVEAAYLSYYKIERWKDFYEENLALVKLLSPEPHWLEQISSHIQPILEEESDEVQELLNTTKDERVLQSSERSHKGDI